MTSEEFNKQYIKNKIRGICSECVYLNEIVNIINKLCSEQYINGLE